MKDDDETRSTTPSETDASRGERGRRDTLRFFGDVSGTDVDDGDDDDAAVVDPGMLPKELSTHWTGFITEIFVFQDTVMPTLLPQILVAFALGLAAQIVKMRSCGADVVAAAECQTTFDITGHQVVSVSLGFLLVFRTDWAYDRYYEGKASLGQLYGGMRNLNVLFVNFLRENRPGECAASAARAAVDGRDPGAASAAPTWQSPRTSRAPRRDVRRADAERAPASASRPRDAARGPSGALRLTNVMYAVMRRALASFVDDLDLDLDSTGAAGFPENNRVFVFSRFARRPHAAGRVDTECAGRRGSPCKRACARARRPRCCVCPRATHNWIAIACRISPEPPARFTVASVEFTRSSVLPRGVQPWNTS